jgi:hypothetical protein
MGYIGWSGLVEPRGFVIPVGTVSDVTIHDAPDTSVALKTDDAWRREQRAFAMMLPSLLATHRDRYVAVHDGKVVAVGTTLVDTALEAYQVVGYVPVYVNLVTDRPRLPVRIPSVRLPENMLGSVDIELVED